MLSLIVDNREKAVFDEIDAVFANDVGKINIEYKQLNTGDFIIMEDKCIRACIERKTAADFIATLKDGRYDNKEKMIELRKKTGCRLIYLITANYNDLPFNVQAAANHLILRDDIHVVYNSVSILKEYIRIYTVMKLPIVEHEEINMVSVVRSELELEVINCWSTLANVSPTVAGELIKKFSIYEFLNADHIDYNFKINERKLSSAAVTSLENFRKTNDTHTKLLTEINGISAATAAEILKNVSIKGMTDVNKFDNVKIGGRKITKKALHVIEIIHYKPPPIVDIITTATATVPEASSDDNDDILIKEQIDSMQLM